MLPSASQHRTGLSAELTICGDQRHVMISSSEFLEYRRPTSLACALGAGSVALHLTGDMEGAATWLNKKFR
jgi:hypothetical protein